MSLERYGAARDAVLAQLVRMEAAVAALPAWSGKDDEFTALVRARERLRDRPFVLAVVGEFSSGKSFLLNALLGKVALEERAGATRIVGLLATDINPSTATITELAYAADERAVATYEDGREERIALDRLARFVAVGEEAKVHDATGDESGAPVRVRVEVDSPFLQSGFIVADTPGLASINPAHRRATLGYLPGADAVLYLIDTQQPFTDGDASFLGIVRRYIESIFIVQTKIDLWRAPAESPVAGYTEAWQSAYHRIQTLAAQHAPNTPVFPVSAREYAEGRLLERPELIEQSRFPAFRAALDASLVANAGGARLRRTRALASDVADRAQARVRLYAEALDRDPAELAAQHEALAPALTAVEARARTERTHLDAQALQIRADIDRRRDDFTAELRQTLARALDIADIARLRDRAKLHIIVDGSVATVAGRFADTLAAELGERLRSAAFKAREAIVRFDASMKPLAATLRELGGEEIALEEIAAHRFGAEAGTGTWSHDLESGLRSEIVLGAIAGPAVALVGGIAARFAAAPHGTYMKRELLADLGSTLFPAFDVEIAAFVDGFAARVDGVVRDVADRIDAIAGHARSAAAGALEQAIEVHAAGAGAVAALRETMAAAAADVRAAAREIETEGRRFAEASEADRLTHADPATPLDATVGTLPAEGSASPFDPVTYEHGLRPERWRVVVLGALGRGKSSLINAIAGRRVLADEGVAGGLQFPVHVRYGPQLRASSLGEDAGWNEIAIDDALEAANHAPILVEVPWTLPRELVLVHTPAFDSGDPRAEEIAFAAARSASEILCLFSRQLSDRELALYARVKDLEKPMSFVHTLADNESSNERRNVVELAERYLRERGIPAARTYTVSALDYRRANDERRIAAPWNELGALTSTLEAHADEHMRRLSRLEEDRRQEKLLAARVGTEERRPSLLARILGKR